MKENALTREKREKLERPAVMRLLTYTTSDAIILDHDKLLEDLGERANFPLRMISLSQSK